MGKIRREVGLVSALSESRLGSLLWPEGVVALALGLGGGIYLLSILSVAERRGVIGDFLPLIAALLGVVFAAFALLMALFSDSYLELLSHARGGVLAFMRPFVIAIGVEVTTVLAAITYRAIALEVPSKVEVGLFLVVCLLGVYAFLDILALARTVTAHGLYRAKLVATQEEANVRRLSTERTRHTDRGEAT